MATQAASGNDGRVMRGNAAVALLNKWGLTKQTAKIVIPHFESDTDADGNIWPGLLRGLSSATGSASGYLNVDPTDATDSGTPGLSNGLFVTLHLILIKLTGWGIKNLPVFIDQVAFGHDVNNQAASFEMQFTVNGVAGKTSL